MFDVAVFYGLGLGLIALGVLVILVAVILASTRGDKGKEGKVKAAGVIMIGPIPIIFGTDMKSAKTVLALALALTIALVIAFIVFWLLR